MRQAYQVQGVLLVHPSQTLASREYEAASKILDGHPDVLKLVEQDLLSGGDIDKRLGRGGLTAEQVLRAAILKQSAGLSYRQLADAIVDSLNFQRFMRLGLGDKAPTKSTLQSNCSRLQPETWEAINRALVGTAADLGIESGEKVRGDCTVVEANVHHPSDSSLLRDTVRVLTERMVRIVEAGYPFSFTNHLRGAKRRALAIQNCRGRDKRKNHYKELTRFTKSTLRSAERSLKVLREAAETSELPAADERLASELERYLELGQRVLDQTRRRVFEAESVPASEKIVSIFEPHTDIIRKDNRGTYYGHKVYISGGKSSLVLDCVIEEGNPADATLVERSLTRLEEITGAIPKQVAFDGGFASKANVALAKELGVEQVCFAKRRGIPIEDMVSSTWMYRQLRRFRAGIEGCISTLKRAYGLSRCTWRGLNGFKSYVWASILTHNLWVLARLRA